MTDKPVVAYNIPSRVVVNIEPGDDGTSSPRSRTVHGREAGERRPRAGEAHRRPRARPSTRATTTSSSRSSSSAARAASACTRTSWGPQTKEMVRRYRDGDVDRRAGAERRDGAGVRASEDPDEPDPDQGGDEPARVTISAATGCRWSIRPSTSSRRCAAASSAPACWNLRGPSGRLPNHPARRSRRGGEEHDRVRGRRLDRRRRRGVGVSARRAPRRRPRASRLLVPRRARAHDPRRRAHARARGPRRRAAVPHARGARSGGQRRRG